MPCSITRINNPDAWEAEISKGGIDGAFVFSDGSLLESGDIGGGAFVVGTDGREQEVECRIGNVVTVWDGGCQIKRNGKVLPGRLEGGHSCCKKSRQDRESGSRHLQEMVGG